MDKNSNAYTFLYAIGLVLVCATLLAGSLGALQGKITANEELNNKKNILGAVNPEIVKADVVETFNKTITQFVINNKGEISEDPNAFSIDIKKAMEVDEDERLLPLFEYNTDSLRAYIIPLRGAGLWDWISVNIALKPDFNTIAGTTFDHKSETPGLGAEIKTVWFQSQFKDKTLSDDNGDFHLKVLKGKGNDISDPNKVDGITGSTMTCNGVQDMLEEGYESYKAYFKNASK